MDLPDCLLSIIAGYLGNRDQTVIKQLTGSNMKIVNKQQEYYKYIYFDKGIQIVDDEKNPKKIRVIFYKMSEFDMSIIEKKYPFLDNLDTNVPIYKNRINFNTNLKLKSLKLTGCLFKMENINNNIYIDKIPDVEKLFLSFVFTEDPKKPVNINFVIRKPFLIKELEISFSGHFEKGIKNISITSKEYSKIHSIKISKIDKSGNFSIDKLKIAGFDNVTRLGISIPISEKFELNYKNKSEINELWLSETNSKFLPKFKSMLPKLEVIGIIN